MIDFNNASFLKLKATKNDAYISLLTPMLVEGEQVISTYQSIRDGIVFTNKRIISVNIQGISGKKKDVTSLPYSKIQAFSIETSGHFDLDSELILWFSSLGQIRLEFTSSSNVSQICKIISQFVL